MTTLASQITSLKVVYSAVYSDADQRKHQSSASLAFVWGIRRDRWIPRKKASYAENVSIWWRHHELAKNGNHTYVADLTVTAEQSNTIKTTWRDRIRTICKENEDDWCLRISKPFSVTAL